MNYQKRRLSIADEMSKLRKQLRKGKINTKLGNTLIRSADVELKALDSASDY